MSKLFGAIVAFPLVFLMAALAAFVLGIIAAIPLYFLWNFLAPTYFSFLPPAWISIPFWNVVWLAWCLGLVRNIIMPSVSATAKAD